MKALPILTVSGRYLGAVAVVGLGLALRGAVAPFLGQHAPLLVAVVTAALAAALWGLGPGILAMLLGELGGDYFFLLPLHTLGPDDPSQWALLALHVLVTGICLGLIEALRRSRAQARHATETALVRELESRANLAALERLHRETTELQGARLALEESESRFQAMADTAPLIVWTSDASGKCTWASKAWTLYTGRQRQEALAEGLHREVHPEDRPRLLETIQNAIHRRESYEIEYRLRRADGEFRWVLDRAAPRLFADGTFAGFIGSCIDVTERKEAERALEDKFDQLRAVEEALRLRNRQLEASRELLETERARYRELFDSAPVAYIITDRHGIIRQVNLAAAAMLNETPEFLAGLPLARMLAKSDRPAFFANIGRLSRREIDGIQNWETTLHPHSRTPFPCSLNANLVEDAPSALNGLRWILRDITERKQAEERALRLNAELEERVRQRTAALEAANRELEAFSYSVSHDLRAPLRSINGFTRAALEDFGDSLDPQAARYLRLAHDASVRMSGLIEDLLQLSRVNRTDLRSARVDLSALSAVVSEHLRVQYPDHPVQFEITPGLQAWGDEGLLRIVLENLLSNAWKFTARQPSPRVEFGRTSVEGREFFFVRDNGAGFDAANAGRLFGVFQRLHSEEEYPGTGVGLATVKRILVRHGGEIRAESQNQQGATFLFWLPDAPHRRPGKKSLEPVRHVQQDALFDLPVDPTPSPASRL